MKQAKKQQQTETKQELTAIKGGKQIPFTAHKDNANFTTAAIVELLLMYNPKVAFPDNPDYQQWGLTTSEMRERRELRKKLEGFKGAGDVLQVSDEMAKHLLDLCSMVKWNGEDDFILEFEDFLK